MVMHGSISYVFKEDKVEPLVWLLLLCTVFLILFQNPILVKSDKETADAIFVTTSFPTR